jgi:hypothetical protein
MDVLTRPVQQRLVITLPTPIAERLRELAAANYRSTKSEAVRLLVEGIDRETAPRSRQ